MKRMSPEEAVKNLGIRSGKLCPCPQDMKNCVCSDHKDSFAIEPFEGDSRDTWDKLIRLVSGISGYKLETQKDDYAHFSFTSGIMKFVDDIEFRLENKGSKILIHCRSASRLGYWDIGANRKRINKIFGLLKTT
ncbi:MAG: DUF1499 domain-containing protein [Pseudobacteriovorax sp.]|nr:DUF1499 domain-containing protein [Pseudobacteriovorax sp.]